MSHCNCTSDTNSNADLELIKEIKRRNGEVLMDAMRKFDGPVGLHELAQSIAKSQKMELCAILKPIRAILLKGVEFGFLYKKCDKYSVYPFHIIKPREQMSRCKMNDTPSKATSTEGLEEPCIPGIRRSSSAQNGKCGCCDSCKKQQNDPCNKQQYDPCNKKQDDPCNKQHKDPCSKQRSESCSRQNFGKQRSASCSRQHIDPCGSNRCNSCSRQNIDPCGSNRCNSCSRQQIDPYGKQRSNSCSRQQIDPYGKQRSNSCSRQHFDPCGQQRSDSCSKQNVNPCGQQRSDSCSKQNVDPCGKRPRSCCYKQRPDPCSRPRSDPCPFLNSSASRTASMSGALRKTRYSISGSKIARVSRTKSAHASNSSLSKKGRKENRRRSSTTTGQKKKNVL